MVFYLELVAKINDVGKYKVAGTLYPDINDRHLFDSLKEEYESILNSGNDKLKQHIILKDDFIAISSIDIVSLGNMIKVLSSSLDITIGIKIKEDCSFIPASCEPLFRMEMRRHC